MTTSERDSSYWTRKRLSRRQALRLGAIGGASALTMLGCQTQSQPGSQATPQATTQSQAGATPAASPTSIKESLPPVPVYSKKYPEINELLFKYHWSKVRDWQNIRPPTKLGGVYYGYAYEPPHFDFTKSLATVIPNNNLNYMNQLINFAVEPGSSMWNWELKPDLAESYEMPDPLTYVFKLNKGVKFHNVPPVNGRECTAEDAKYCFDVYRDKRVPHSSLLSEVNSLATPDKYTFKFTTSEPVAHMINTLAARIMMVFSREVYEAPGELFARQPIGTGPMIFKEYTPKVRHVMVKNPDYFRKDRWGGKLPYMDGAVLTAITDPALREAAFRTKQTDNWSPGTAEQFLALMKDFPDAQGTVAPVAPTVANHILLKQNKKPFDDVRVRRAMSMAIDRTDFIDTVYKGFAVPTCPIPINLLGESWPRAVKDQGEWYQYNPEKAKQLLAEAGYPNGFKASVVSGVMSGISAGVLPYMQAAWKKVGVEVEITSLDTNAFTKTFEEGSFPDMAHASTTVSGGPDPDVYVTYRKYSKSQWNNSGINDPVLDDLILKQRRAMNKTERIQILREIEKREYDQCHLLYFPGGNRALVVHPYVHVATDHYGGYVDAGQQWQKQYRWLDENAPRRQPIT